MRKQRSLSWRQPQGIRFSGESVQRRLRLRIVPNRCPNTTEEIMSTLMTLKPIK
jgi:hypothetical protein